MSSTSSTTSGTRSRTSSSSRCVGTAKIEHVRGHERDRGAERVRARRGRGGRAERHVGRDPSDAPGGADRERGRPEPLPLPREHDEQHDVDAPRTARGSRRELEPHASFAPSGIRLAIAAASATSFTMCSLARIQPGCVAARRSSSTRRTALRCSPPHAGQRQARPSRLPRGAARRAARSRREPRPCRRSTQSSGVAVEDRQLAEAAAELAFLMKQSMPACSSRFLKCAVSASVAAAPNALHRRTRGCVAGLIGWNELRAAATARISRDPRRARAPRRARSPRSRRPHARRSASTCSALPHAEARADGQPGRGGFDGGEIAAPCRPAALTRRP